MSLAPKKVPSGTCSHRSHTSGRAPAGPSPFPSARGRPCLRPLASVGPVNHKAPPRPLRSPSPHPPPLGTPPPLPPPDVPPPPPGPYPPHTASPAPADRPRTPESSPPPPPAKSPTGSVSPETGSVRNYSRVVAPRLAPHRSGSRPGKDGRPPLWRLHTGCSEQRWRFPGKADRRAPAIRAPHPWTNAQIGTTLCRALIRPAGSSAWPQAKRKCRSHWCEETEPAHRSTDPHVIPPQSSRSRPADAAPEASSPGPHPQCHPPPPRNARFSPLFPGWGGARRRSACPTPPPWPAAALPAGGGHSSNR